MNSSNFLNRHFIACFYKPVLFTLATILFFTACEDKKTDTPTPGKEEIQTLELNFVNVDNGEVFDLSMVPRPIGDGPWEFQSIEPHPWLPIPVERNIVISDEEINKIGIYDDGKGNFTLTDVDGNLTEWTGTYTVENGPAANEITYRGTLTDGISHFEFVGVTDPAPLVVIAVAGIGAAICALLIGLDDCENSTSIQNLIEACQQNGGKPQLTVSTTFSLWGGCGTECKFECK